MDKKNESFKPYISADKVLPEFTVTSILMGIILAVVFGAANAYLGLKVGMTVSASIPAAVISLGVIRVIMKKNSILESNMVQTIGSAGESLAAGAIFTMPALFLWAEEGKIDMPGYLEITLIALFGAVLAAPAMAQQGQGMQRLRHALRAGAIRCAHDRSRTAGAGARAQCRPEHSRHSGAAAPAPAYLRAKSD